MQVKKIRSFFELFINKIFEYTFVTFKYEQTIDQSYLFFDDYYSDPWEITAI